MRGMTKPELNIPLALGVGAFFGGLYWGITFVVGDSTVAFLPAALLVGALTGLASRSGRSGARFSLPAMLILATLLALWFGSQAIIVRERKAAFDYAVAAGADFDVVDRSDHWVRGMLGDFKFTSVVISREDSPPEMEAVVRRRFPEAQISYR